MIAHRGGRDWAPENTLAAFQKAINMGAGGVELDIHRCASGELVVIHDDDLARTTNGIGLIKDAGLEELKRLSAGAWFDKEFKDERIPLLREVLEIFPQNMLLNIEIKNAPQIYDGIEEDLLAELDGFRHLNILVSSFDHYCLKRLRALDSKIKIGVLAAAALIDIKSYLAAFDACCFIAAYDCLTPELHQEIKTAGLELMVWTVNKKAEWQNLIELGVHAICTDTPQALQNYYQERDLPISGKPC